MLTQLMLISNIVVNSNSNIDQRLSLAPEFPMRQTIPPACALYEVSLLITAYKSALQYYQSNPLHNLGRHIVRTNLIEDTASRFSMAIR